MNSAELDSKIDELYDLRADIRAKMRVINELKDIANEIEEQIMATMADMGLKKAGTPKANVSVSSTVVPSVDPEYWNEVRVWAVENDYQELLPRTMNQTSYRELREIGIEVPHTKDFTKYKMSLTKGR